MSQTSTEADAYFATYEEPASGTARSLRTLLTSLDERIEEGVKWNAPSYHVGGVHFATFNVRPGRPLRLVLHRDAKARPDAGRLPVPDDDGLLEWRGHDRANVTLEDERAARAARPSLTATLRGWIDHL